jgi:NTP pyrophosphatase (non-canonical NTP hydrolase)
MRIAEFQRLIEQQYLERDRRRGLGGTFMWFLEEVGELATALRTGGQAEMSNEFADVFAWLSTLASLSGVELAEAVQKYANGCPRCHKASCECPEKK